MKIFECSSSALSSSSSSDSKESVNNPLENDSSNININIFYQFFIHKNRIRNMENIECLHRNLKNPKIDKIYLLNERIYSDEDFGFVDDYATQAQSGKIKPLIYVNGITKALIEQKLHQENVVCRLKYSDIFKYINDKKIKGYNVFINSDIFFDESISKIRNTNIHIKKQMISLLRFEYSATHKNLNQAPIFGPRFDSQDTWIIHSNFKVTDFQQRMFNFHFGTPGCDNKMLYLMKILGYEIINDPKYIKSYHCHSDKSRNYELATIKNPWSFSMPYGYEIPAQYKALFEHPRQRELSFCDNERLYSYVSSKVNSNSAFIIPRISTDKVLSTVYFGNIVYEKYFKNIGNEQSIKISNEDDELIKTVVTEVKKTTGIIFTSLKDYIRFSLEYLTAFRDSECYIDWAIQDEEYSSNNQVNDFMYDNFAMNKQRIWNYALEIYHYIYSPCIWTHAFRGKRVLIITPYSNDTMVARTNPEITKQLYDGVELFPECKLSFITGPNSKGGGTESDSGSESGSKSSSSSSSSSVHDDLKALYDRISMKMQSEDGDFDVALVSCGGYTNLVGNYICKNLNRGAICFGDELFAYFGIYNQYMISKRPDVIKLFVHKNDAWVKFN
jgi:hypothetical protein